MGTERPMNFVLPWLNLLAPLLAALGYIAWGRCTLLVSGPTAMVLLFLLKDGVDESCLINESECIGSTAVLYIVLMLWLLAIAALAASMVYRRLIRSSGSTGSK